MTNQLFMIKQPLSLTTPLFDRRSKHHMKKGGYGPFYCNKKGKRVLNHIEFLTKSYFRGLSSPSSRVRPENRVLIGKLNYHTLPGNKLVVEIPYFAPVAFPIKDWEKGRVIGNSKKGELKDKFKNVDALGIAITQLVSNELVNSRLVINSGLSMGMQMSVELRLVGLRYPYLDNLILAQYVAYNAGKYNFTRMHKVMFQKRSVINQTVASSSSAPVITNPLSLPFFPNQLSPGGNLGSGNRSLRVITNEINNGDTQTLHCDSLPGHVRGLKVELAGRLTTQRSIPRKTVRTQQTGSFKVTKNKGLFSSNQYASKNKLGAYTIKV